VARIVEGEGYMEMLPRSERRDSNRWPHYKGLKLAVDGRMVELIDLSTTGARVASNVDFECGSVVVMDLPWGKKSRATVISGVGGIIRLRFFNEIEEPY
jgi:hypothetical protein